MDGIKFKEVLVVKEVWVKVHGVRLFPCENEGTKVHNPQCLCYVAIHSYNSYVHNQPHDSFDSLEYECVWLCAHPGF